MNAQTALARVEDTQKSPVNSHSLWRMLHPYFQLNGRSHVECVFSRFGIGRRQRKGLRSQAGTMHRPQQAASHVGTRDVYIHKPCTLSSRFAPSCANYLLVVRIRGIYLNPLGRKITRSRDSRDLLPPCKPLLCAHVGSGA